MKHFLTTTVFALLALPAFGQTIEDVKDFCQGSVEVIASAERGQVVYSSDEGLQGDAEALELKERGAPIERLNFDEGEYLECIVVLTDKFGLTN
jgi:hypothetical protein